MPTPAKLTRNEKLVLDALRGGAAPQTAYQLLDVLRADGLKAPLQIYRALRSLGDRHLVHKLDSQNAFVACSHGPVGHRHAVAFLICTACARAVEVADPELDRQVSRLATRNGFTAQDTTVEMRGICADCQALAPAHEHAGADTA